MRLRKTVGISFVSTKKKKKQESWFLEVEKTLNKIF